MTSVDYNPQNIAIADLLFPNITKIPQDWEKVYPKRILEEGAMVTRFAPSPTGFLHIGGVLASLISQRLASQSDGVFILRIEDTDKKREIENGVELIVNGLNNFGIEIDEGMLDDTNEKGIYGPYKQSERGEIYQTYVKELIRRGVAYPCFLTHEELANIRSQQEKLSLRPGYYGKWAVSRNISFEEIEKNIKEENSFVVRLKSSGVHENSVKFTDMIKGTIEMAENDQDVVILKSDGLPTYHFAHAVDDYLMGTTHVIRGDEWLASVPLHIELFRTLGWEHPKYCHIAPIVKFDGNSKRKLSKRKDPEASVTYYHEQGYSIDAVIEYLLTLANSNYEEWRMENPEADNKEFMLSFEKMSVSGALFDMKKLLDISKNVIANMTAEQVYNETITWARQFDKELAELMEKYDDYTKHVLNVERNTEKPRKDFAKWSDVKQHIQFFYKELFDETAEYTLPENLSDDNVKEILNEYMKIHNVEVDKTTWFANLKSLALELGYAKNGKTYKKDPESYKGHIGDFAMVLRVALAKSTNTPDLYEIMKVMGNEMVFERFYLCKESL